MDPFVSAFLDPESQLHELARLDSLPIRLPPVTLKSPGTCNLEGS